MARFIPRCETFLLLPDVLLTPCFFHRASRSARDVPVRVGDMTVPIGTSVVWAIFAVIQAFDVAQHQCFPERRRQRRNCGAELIGVDLGEEGCLWRLQIRIDWVGLRKPSTASRSSTVTPFFQVCVSGLAASQNFRRG